MKTSIWYSTPLLGTPVLVQVLYEVRLRRKLYLVGSRERGRTLSLCPGPGSRGEPRATNKTSRRNLEFTNNVMNGLQMAKRKMKEFCQAVFVTTTKKNFLRDVRDDLPGVTEQMLTISIISLLPYNCGIANRTMMISSSSTLRAKAVRFSQASLGSVFLQRSFCFGPCAVPDCFVLKKCSFYRIEGQRQSSFTQNRYHQIMKTRFSTAPALQKERTVIPFLLADIGEGIHEVELIKWNVQVGDTVEQFDLICQVQSDKATVDITSRFDGTIVELAGNVGDMIQVGKPLVFLETTTYEASEDRPAVASGQNLNPPSTSMTMIEGNTKIIDDFLEDIILPAESSPSSNPQVTNIKIQTSPAVRKICKEKSIDPSVIPATGPQGRLLKEDVLTFINSAHKSQTTIDDESVAEISMQNIEGEIVELRGYTRAMAKAMTQSLEIPHMCLGDEIDVTQLLVIRKEFNETMSTKLSLLAFIVKACSLALKEYPVLNAAMNSESSIRMQSRHRIGVAMDTSRGLVVPVLGDCSTMSIVEIQGRLDSLKDSRDDIALDSTRPTFTLSNIGALGAGLSLQPVLVPPQLAMGAIGRLQRLPRFGKNDEVVASSILPITWTADHRYVDGAQLARFHVRVQELLINPFEMMVYMK